MDSADTNCLTPARDGPTESLAIWRLVSYAPFVKLQEPPAGSNPPFSTRFTRGLFMNRIQPTPDAESEAASRRLRVELDANRPSPSMTMLPSGAVVSNTTKG
jgi:hypothetical protein